MTVPTPARIGALLEDGLVVSELTRIEPWTVGRVTVAGASGRRTAVVKWLRQDPTDHRRDPAQLRREADALRFVAALDPDLGPALLGADTDGPDPLLVLEDLAPREPVRGLLLDAASVGTPGSDGAATTARLLSDYVHTLARQAALTAPSRSEVWLPAARRCGVSDGPPRPELTAWTDGIAAVESLGVGLSTAARAELTEAARTLADPGAFRVFSNGDAQHNNVLTAAGLGPRLIDFENAGFQHALVDLLNLYLPGSMWLTVGDARSATRLEDAYRRDVVPMIPEAADDHRFAIELGGLAVLSAIARTAGLPRLDAKPVGDLGRLHRVATYEAAARVADRASPALAGWCRRTADALRRRWPDTDVDLDALPPFTSR